MNMLAEIDDDIAKLFRAAGYQVTWDVSRREGVMWYEVMDDEGLLCQIDMGIPYADLIPDLIGLKNCVQPYEIHLGPNGRDPRKMARYERFLTKLEEAYTKTLA